MSRFDRFDRIDLPYRVINGAPLEVTILIPASIAKSRQNHEKKSPVMVRWHGGGFIVGERMYEPWFAQWLLDLALEQGAIILSPDYRLLPESNGSDIFDDVAHFWRWAQNKLPQYLEQRSLPRADLSKILCCGESSGGFISVYCALNLESILKRSDAVGSGSDEMGVERLEISVVISISAPLDTSAPEYKVPRPRVFMGRRPPPPRQALAIIRGYIKDIPQGRIRTGCEPTPDMWELLLCIAQQAALPRLFDKGTGTGARPALESVMEALEKGDRRMVPVWIVHGTDDTMCPSSCSSNFFERLRKIQPRVPAHLTLSPGEHLFDVKTGKDADWVQEGVEFLQCFWPCISGQVN